MWGRFDFIDADIWSNLGCCIEEVIRLAVSKGALSAESIDDGE